MAPENENGGPPEPRTSYEFGPEAEQKIQELREAISEEGEPPVDTNIVFTAALRLLENGERAFGRGQVMLVEKLGPGVYSTHGLDREDVQEAFAMWSEAQEEGDGDGQED